MTDTNTNPPVEGAVSGEGDNLKEAIQAGAALLELEPSMVDYKLDLAHFKNPKSGINMGVDTVKVWVFPKDPAIIEITTKAQAWMAELLERMELGGKVLVAVDGKLVKLRVDTEKGGYLVGKRGVTIDAVRTLLVASMGAEYPDWKFRVDVMDQRRDRDDRGGRGRDRDDRRGRGRDRDDRGGRGRDRDDRGGRGRDRDDRRSRGRDRDDRGGRGRDRDRDDRGGRGRDRDDDKGGKTRQRDIERLAHRLAKRVLESGKDELIRKEMNSFARRVVHMVVAEYEGLATESVGEGQHKQIRIMPKGEEAGTA